MKSKLEDILAAVKISEFLNGKEPVVVEEKKNSTLKTILIIVGVVALVAAVAYAVYKFMTPDYLDICLCWVC